MGIYLVLSPILALQYVVATTNHKAPNTPCASGEVIMACNVPPGDAQIDTFALGGRTDRRGDNSSGRSGSTARSVIDPEKKFHSLPAFIRRRFYQIARKKCENIFASQYAELRSPCFGRARFARINAFRPFLGSA